MKIDFRFKCSLWFFLLTSKFYIPCFRTLASGDKVFFKFSATVSAILLQWSSKKKQQSSVFEIQLKRFRIEKFKERSFHNHQRFQIFSKCAIGFAHVTFFTHTCFVPSLLSGQKIVSRSLLSHLFFLKFASSKKNYTNRPISINVNSA